jgi:hypothetical protein
MEEVFEAAARAIYVGTICLAIFLFSLLCLIELGAFIQWMM